jgi:capsular polysaccharide biosynthesis protein
MNAGRPFSLHLASEREALAETTAETLAGARPPSPGAWAVTRVGGHLLPEMLMERVAGRVGGGPLPAWSDGSDGARRGQTAVFRAQDVALAPRHGTLVDGQGQVFRCTAGEMLSWKPDLAALPLVEADGEVRRLVLPENTPRVAAATVFMATGGEFNYGHYLLDCLAALLAVEEQGLLKALPPIAPRLKPWQQDLLGLAFPALKVRQTRKPWVRLGEAAFASPMDHFLHRPNRLLLSLRERILAAAPPFAGAKRVYISRRAYPMRVMVNEPALEAALATRGFTIVRAETLSPSQQVALVRGAEVVVGATGAGLANALFAPPHAKVFEILPATFANWWLRNLCHLAEVDWHGYFCPAPVDASEVSWKYRIRRGFRWGYRLPLEEFLRFLDERL